MSVIVALVAGGCGGSSDEPEAAPTATVAIEEAPTATPPPEPTATPAPTAPPTATEAPAPTPTPEPSDEEAAIRAAWERYLDLSIQARGKDPSAESLDFDSYVTGAALDGLQRALGPAEDYAVGTVTSSDPAITQLASDEIQIFDCLLVDLEFRSPADDSLSFEEIREASAEGRVSLIDGRWIVSGFAVDRGDRCAR